MAGNLEFLDPSEMEQLSGNKRLFNFEFIYSAQLNRILYQISSGQFQRQDILVIKRSILALDRALEPYWTNDYNETKKATLAKLNQDLIYSDKDDYFEVLMEWLGEIVILLDRLNLGLKKTVSDRM